MTRTGMEAQLCHAALNTHMSALGQTMLPVVTENQHPGNDGWISKAMTAGAHLRLPRLGAQEMRTLTSNTPPPLATAVAWRTAGRPMKSGMQQMHGPRDRASATGMMTSGEGGLVRHTTTTTTTITIAPLTSSPLAAATTSNKGMQMMTSLRG